MKAIVQDAYGSADVLELRDIPKPVPKDNEVLVRVHAAGLHRGDWHVMTGLPYLIRIVVPALGLRRPKVLVRGMDVAGTVAAVGEHVTRFQPGDAVFGWCDGSFAEYACAPEDHFAPKPANLSFEQAAAVPTSGFAALQGLRDMGEVQPGQKVLVIGAAGAVGLFAVQLAKAFGAQVTGVCSTAQVELVRSIGRRRRGHRLHPRRLRRRDTPLGPDPRHRGPPFAITAAACPYPQGDADDRR
jgi:NADPH:quinone reductase-like Zn-dependent oxidoreductase